MDESWDADFDGDLRVPDSVITNSTTIRSEVQAAKKLATITAHLKELLLLDINAPSQPLKKAVLIVQASTINEQDEFYKSEAFKKYGNETSLEIGTSIEDVLQQAVAVENELLPFWEAKA